MRKLKLQVQISLDGYVAGSKGEMNWMVWDWDDQLNHYVAALTDSVDTILLGRKMADGFVAHWNQVAADPEHPEHTAGIKFMETPKVVFSKTLRESPWENTTLASGDITQEVNLLKQQKGKDLIVYGGAGFVSSLIKANLIDEFHLFVNPTILGAGMSIFEGISQMQYLSLKQATGFKCGITLLHYELKR